MFHWVQGVPFEFNAGAFDNQNLWEQIDGGDQYTPAKKFLLAVPILLFLISTHYTHYDLTYFVINCMATLAVVIPKLPAVSLNHSTMVTKIQANDKTIVSQDACVWRRKLKPRPDFLVFRISLDSLEKG